jgi:hypothetical protein
MRWSDAEGIDAEERTGRNMEGIAACSTMICMLLLHYTGYVGVSKKLSIAAPRIITLRLTAFRLSGFFIP